MRDLGRRYPVHICDANHTWNESQTYTCIARVLNNNVWYSSELARFDWTNLLQSTCSRERQSAARCGYGRTRGRFGWTGSPEVVSRSQGQYTLPHRCLSCHRTAERCKIKSNHNTNSDDIRLVTSNLWRQSDVLTHDSSRVGRWSGSTRDRSNLSTRWTA